MYAGHGGARFPEFTGRSRVPITTVHSHGEFRFSQAPVRLLSQFPQLGLAAWRSTRARPAGAPPQRAGFQKSEVRTMSDTDADAARAADREAGGAWVPPQGLQGQPPPPGYWSPPQPGEPGQPPPP